VQELFAYYPVENPRTREMQTRFPFFGKVDSRVPIPLKSLRFQGGGKCYIMYRKAEGATHDLKF
jgi:hypothetical protein